MMMPLATLPTRGNEFDLAAIAQNLKTLAI
jgi:hypothetical protein